MSRFIYQFLNRTLAVAITVIYLSLSLSSGAANNSRPNILVVLADDIGWGDSRINNPDSLIAMPNLEQLAAEGLRFTDAHTATSMCAPTRYTIMTGNYQWRGRRAYGVWDHYSGSQILSGQRTLADTLKDAGYATGIIGKLHLGGRFYLHDSDEFAAWNSDPNFDLDYSRKFADGPLDHGFDTSFLALAGIQKAPYAFFKDDLLVGNANDLVQWEAGWYGPSRIYVGGIGAPDWDSSEVGPTLTSKAIDFIDTHHSQNLALGTDKPFFLFYSAQAAHGPWTPPQNLLGEPVAGVTGISGHTDMIYELDVTLGHLIAALETRGLADDTLIIFTDDNGGHAVSNSLGHESMGGLRGAKGTIWEGGHRVPFVAKWGDGTLAGSVIEPGTVSEQLIGVHDLMATIAALVGESLPADQAHDSFNLLPVFLGEIGDEIPLRDHLIAESTIPGTSSPSLRQKAFRQGQWKLVFDENEVATDLYDLTTDVAETNNLFSDPAHAARVTQMHSDFDALMAQARTAPVSDIDSDAVPDTLDNCMLISNTDQRDSDGDGYGNVCDADLNQDCVINFVDLGIFAEVVFTDDPHADFDGNGVVNFLDLAVFQMSFLMAPGPSGVSGLCD